MVGSEVFSGEVKKTEVLSGGFRRAIGECSIQVERVLFAVQEASLTIGPLSARLTRLLDFRLTQAFG
jgi:DNA helicase TIP49 (TBP-interacting protein)